MFLCRHVKCILYILYNKTPSATSCKLGCFKEQIIIAWQLRFKGTAHEFLKALN